MLRKKGMKASLCVTLVLMILFSFGSAYAFADTQKVTKQRAYDFVAPIEVIDNIRQSISNSTYDYDDGIYKGTLPFVSFSDWHQTYQSTNGDYHMYQFTFNANYSGTVSSYTLPDTKTVTAQRAYNITAPIEVIDNIRQSISNSTHDYDDGSYKGTLPFVSFSDWHQTYQSTNGDYHMYLFTFNANYSGTVTAY